MVESNAVHVAPPSVDLPIWPCTPTARSRPFACPVTSYSHRPDQVAEVQALPSRENAMFDLPTATNCWPVQQSAEAPRPATLAGAVQVTPSKVVVTFVPNASIPTTIEPFPATTSKDKLGRVSLISQFAPPFRDKRHWLAGPGEMSVSPSWTTPAGSDPERRLDCQATPSAEVNIRLLEDVATQRPPVHERLLSEPALRVFQGWRELATAQPLKRIARRQNTAWKLNFTNEKLAGGELPVNPLLPQGRR